MSRGSSVVHSLLAVLLIVLLLGLPISAFAAGGICNRIEVIRTCNGTESKVLLYENGTWYGEGSDNKTVYVDTNTSFNVILWRSGGTSPWTFRLIGPGWDSGAQNSTGSFRYFSPPMGALGTYFGQVDTDSWKRFEIVGVAPNQPPTAYIDSITPDPATQGTDTVSFTGHGTDSDGSVVAYSWRSSIDGQLSTSSSFSKPASELSEGTHTIYFKVKDNDGAWSTEDTEALTIESAPTPNQPPNTPSNPSPANHATAVLAHVNLGWTGGDPDAGDTVTYDVYFGTSSTPPLISNNQPWNNYYVGVLGFNTKYYWRIVATDNHGASTTGPLWDFTTGVHEALILECDVSPNPTEVGHETDFLGIASGGVPPYSWLWTIDGTVVATTQNTAYIFTTARSYTVCVTVTDAIGDEEECCRVVTVKAPLSLECNISPNPTEVGHETDFTALAGGGLQPYSWSWTISGTEIATTQNTAHIFTTAGSYTVCVTVTDALDYEAQCCTNVEASGGSTPTPNQPPTAYIDSISPNPATQGTHTVSFSGHGTDPDGSVNGWNWRSSKDGQLSTSSSFSKPASELSAGTHTIYFKVKDDDGVWSTQDTESLTIESAHAPQLNIDLEPVGEQLKDQLLTHGTQITAIALKGLIGYGTAHVPVLWWATAGCAHALYHEVAHYGAVNLILGGIFTTAEDMAEDPPDPNYTKVATLPDYEVFEPTGDSNLEYYDAMWYTCLSEQAAIMEALLTSMERLWGATNANDQTFISIQTEAVTHYSSMLAQNQADLSYAVQAFINELNLYYEQVQEPIGDIQAEIAANGFSEEQLQSFYDAGMSDDMIDEVRQAIITSENVSWPSFVVLAEDWTDMINSELLPTLSKIANVPPIVNAGHNAIINEGEVFFNSGSFIDFGTGNNTYTGTVDYGDGSGVQPLELNPDNTFVLNHTYLNDNPTDAPWNFYTVTVTVTDENGSVGTDTVIVTVNNVAPSESEGISTSGETCFIATAAYGTPMAEEIQILREFRDEYLLTNPLGQGFVDFYYKVSPPMAEFITQHPSLKPIVRAGLLPAVAMSAVVINTTLAEKMAIGGLLVLVSVVLAVWAMRQQRRGIKCV